MAMQPNSRFKPCLVSPTGSGERQAPTVHLDGTWLRRLTCRTHSCGGVAERLKAAVLKTAGPQGLAGSNPASSAKTSAGLREGRRQGAETAGATVCNFQRNSARACLTVTVLARSWPLT